MIREILPRLVIGALLFSGAFFAYFESVYLGDQFQQFGEGRIAIWTWIFRGLTTAMLIASVIFLVQAIRRLFF